jgi:hypothetical protein
MNIFTEHQTNDSNQEYYSAEFQLNNSKIMFQFKLRKSLNEPMFAVVKEGSTALENINEGDVVDMHYHHLDKTMPVELRQTRIKYISKDSTIGFKDHYVVGLSLNAREERSVA